MIRKLSKKTWLKTALAIASTTALSFACSSNSDSPQQPTDQSAGNPAAGRPTDGPNLRVDEAAILPSIELGQQDFAEDDCAVIEKCVAGPGTRKLLRFEGDVINAGNQDIVLGDPELNPHFHVSPCHGHFHLEDMMEYALIDAETGNVVNVQHGPVVARKQGFCLRDSEPTAAVDPNTPGKYTCSHQGISAGWEDIYDNSLDCQWLDVTDVPSGNYLLRLTVNPDHAYPETNPNDNVAEVPVFL